MDRDLTKEHFERQWSNTFYPPKDVEFVIYSKRIWNFVKNLIKDSKEIVDLGAGGGTLLYNVQKITKAKLVAVDFSDTALGQLKTIVPGAIILKEDVTATSLSDSDFDFCLSTMVIEHVDDTSFLREIYRILRPNKYLFITSVLRTKNAWYFYKNKEGKSVLEPSHLREYTSPKEFIGMITKSGFKVLELEISRISFPLIDPFLKIGSRFLRSNFWAKFCTAQPIEFMRKITKVPIPGYFAIEVVAQKER